MSVVNDFWSEKAKELRSQFDQARIKHTDSSIKGGINEDILADFLDENFAPRWTARRSTIIDSTGRRSDEVDIALCNEYQPFPNRERPLLIAEGVDAVVQVKARLTTTEIDRMVKNCQTVKWLTRVFSEHDATYSNRHDYKAMAKRIPYFCFCYESEITAETAGKRLVEACGTFHKPFQFDGLFVLDRFEIVNVRDNKGLIQVHDNVTGFVMDPRPEAAFTNFLWTLYSAPPKVQRVRHPILKYGPKDAYGPAADGS